MCDKKQASIDFAKATYGKSGSCMFSTIEEVTTRGGFCHMHSRSCALQDVRPDFVVIGPPCQPYSGMRANRKLVPPHCHADWPVLFVNFVEYLTEIRPHGGILEEVPGFASPVPPGKDENGDDLPATWLAKFLSILRSLGYWAQVLKMNNSIWTESARERFSSVTFLAFANTTKSKHVFRMY
jgi:site-specific DNA-cytosine methylase